MAIMSKIETTSKVSLKLPNRINLGRQGAAHQALDFGHSPQPPPPPFPTARREPSTGQKGPIPPTGTTNNPPPRTAKAAKPQSVPAQPPTLDTAHKPPKAPTGTTNNTLPPSEPDMPKIET